jgi:hypothetical protein
MKVPRWQAEPWTPSVAPAPATSALMAVLFTLSVTEVSAIFGGTLIPFLIDGIHFGSWNQAPLLGGDLESQGY